MSVCWLGSLKGDVAAAEDDDEEEEEEEEEEVEMEVDEVDGQR